MRRTSTVLYSPVFVLDGFNDQTDNLSRRIIRLYYKLGQSWCGVVMIRIAVPTPTIYTAILLCDLCLI